jgi:PAS domain S-box-containing protein
MTSVKDPAPMPAVVGKILLVTFVIETLVMFLLPYVLPAASSAMLVALVDAALLTVLISPFVWLFVVRPIRTNAETALWEKNETLRALINASPLAIIALDPNGTVRSWNAAAEGIFGWSEQEVIGRPLPSVPPDKQEEFRKNRERVLRGESYAGVTGWRVRKDGSPILISISTSPLYTGKGAIIGILNFMEDITGQKQNEERIVRLNRVTSMLSAVNKAIVHIRKQQKLFEEVCRIAVEQGRFRMTWIGLADPGTGTVNPVAHSGFEDGYLGRIGHTPDDAPQDSGPPGQAMQRGRHVVSNAIEHNKTMLPWREEALKRGYRSSAAFPLLTHGQVVGTINFYAAEPDFFDDDEIRLLDELALDVSFALEFMDKEEQRVAAEALVEQTKQDWEDAFNTLTDMITVHDKDFNIIRANTAAEKVLKIPGSGSAKTKCFTQYHGTACPPQGCPSCGSLVTGKASVSELYEPHLNMFMEVRAIPRLDAGNNITGLIHVVRDITERKRLEESLLENRTFAENLIQNSAVATFVLNPQHKVILWNKACEELSGIPAADMIGTDRQWRPFYPHQRPTLADIVIEGNLEDVADLYSRSTQSTLVKNGLQSEGWYGNLNGKKRYILFDAVPICNSKGDLVVAIETLQDVTALRRVEEDLEKSENRLRTIIETVPECVKLISGDGAVLEMNRAGLAMVEADTFAEVKEISVYPLILPEYRDAFTALNERVFAGGSGTLEFEMVGLKGTRRWVETRSAPLRSANGAISAILAVTRDITGQKKLEAQLRHAHKMEAIGTLTGGIAHDFNNILTAIIGYSNILKLKLKPGEPSRPLVDQILTSAERATSLTQSLLAFSRKVITNLRPLDLNDTVQRAEKLLRRFINEDIELETVLGGGNAIVVVDTGQIEQVLMNLATNARDAMPDGGRLTITTSRAELGNDFIRTYGYGKPGTYAVVTVTDTGVGMDERTRERIFEPFFTTKEVGKGTGLGLSIVYGIIKSHNGFINCSSTPGRGTSFAIYLPLARTTVPYPAVKESPIPRGGTETILVAEDDPEVRKLTLTFLQDFGYAIIEAEDGETAVRKFVENKDAVSLLLFDVIMPRQDGKAAYEAIKRMAPGIKVLFLSGYNASMLAQKGITEDVPDFILKPVSPETLLKKVREVLDK